MKNFTYTNGCQEYTDSINLNELSMNCHQCYFNKNNMVFITFLYLNILLGLDNDIKVRSFCSDICLNKYLRNYRNNSNDIRSIFKVLNANISNEDFLRELNKFEGLVRKSWMLK